MIGGFCARGFTHNPSLKAGIENQAINGEPAAAGQAHLTPFPPSC